MDSEKLLFEKGCFLPSWVEDDSQIEPQTHLSEAYTNRHKDLDTLLGELAEIKEHIQDVRQRQWDLALMLKFHNNGLVRE